MRRFIRCTQEDGLAEIEQWEPHCWVIIEQPDAADVQFMLDKLKIPHDFVESIGDPDERPRFDRDGNWLLTIIRIPLKIKSPDEAPFITVPMGIIFNGEIALTLCYYHTKLVPDFIQHAHHRELRIDNEPDFILRLIYSSTYWFLKYLKEINDYVSHSDGIFNRSISNDQLIKLMGMQKSLVFFNTSIKGNEVLIDRMRKIYPDLYDVDLLEDVEVEIKQAANTVDVYTDILQGLMDSFASIISNNVNDIMRKMTGVSIVLMFPTLIASFYGMNVTLTYGQSPWAFWVIVVSSLLLAIILYFILKRFRWL